MASRPVAPNPSDQDVGEWLNIHAVQGTPERIPYEEHGYAARFLSRLGRTPRDHLWR